MIDKAIDNFWQAFKGRWQVFALSLVVQLIVSIFLNLGLKTPINLNFLLLPKIQIEGNNLKSPIPSEWEIFDLVKPKLEQIGNDFQLHKEVSLVSKAFASSDFDQAKAYLVIDNNTGQVLAEKNSSRRLPIASLTKIMTAVTVLDLASLNEQFKISAKAASEPPTKIGVVSGQQIEVTELLSALMLTSANDAAQVLKEGVESKYSSPIFIRAMNAKADFLGLKNSSFANPQGFDSSKNYSTAEDLAILSHYALKNYPYFAGVVQKDYQYIPADGHHKQYDLYNWNGLIGVYPGTFGVKIGNTDDAGFTTVVASERGGKQVLVVLLGIPGALERDLWASELLDLGFSKLGLASVNITERQLQAKYSTWKYWN